MKGFWRAVRRGEPWALAIDKKQGFERMFALYFRNVDWAAEMARPALSSLIPKGDPWVGGSLIVPFKVAK